MLINRAPKIISKEDILNRTYYDMMTNRERELIFKAYIYNKTSRKYVLTHPEFLTKDIIDKLI